MRTVHSRRRGIAALAIGFALLSNLAANASPTCPDEQTKDQGPRDLELCNRLEPIVRSPSALPLNQYEEKLGEYLGAMCHRNEDGGWKVDKRVRDAGPWIGAYANGKWTGQGYGTHAPVLIWYSPLMYEWLKENRGEFNTRPVTEPPVPVPDGAMMIKEMYPYPAAACAGVNVLKLKANTQSSAVMVRDSNGSHDGWFWGWYGWEGSGWAVDWPATANSPYPNMGFGQYCTNCHASAKDNSTFATPKNIKGEPGEPLVFLSQNFFIDPSWKSLQARIQEAASQDAKAKDNDPPYNDAFTKIFSLMGGAPQPPRSDIVKMPPETYDSVWPKKGEPNESGQYLTSDQCLGCHSAGGTGLQFDMTQPGPDGKLVNISPYGTWRGSPMGLAGRDPIFFAQLASETEKFHPGKENKKMIEDTCLGCHGILGQRQHAIDTKLSTGSCQPFARDSVNKIPYSKNHEDPVSALANYGALARDGISCTSCHHMVLGKEDSAKYAGQAQNTCIDEKQQALNPGFTGFASTFTGAFLVGPPGDLYGPFKEPKKKPMKHAIGVDPVHSQTITTSEMCGSCHTVHLPIMHRGQTIGHVYEQTTYPEWAFSDYRTGDSPDGPLPYGSGAVNKTAVVTVGDVRVEGGTLNARVTVVNRVGHKFPSGVGFRRAFLQFSVLDVNNKELWTSGKTDAAGVIIDQNKDPIEGELWWTKDCQQRIEPEKRSHQPHYQEITRQNQAQIYQELVSTPADVPAPVCGPGVKAEGQLTTSFLSICTKVKDNRILPQGFLKLEDRLEISQKLGADEVMARDTSPEGVGNDPDYVSGGGDSLVYRVPLTELVGTPAAVQATLYYQPTPPFYLQDRFCTANGDDTKRLYYLTGKVDLTGSTAQDWKLRVVTSGPVTVP